MIELMPNEELEELEKELAPKPLPADKYPVQVDDATEEVSGGSGKRMIKWTFKTVNCDDPSHNGRLLFNYTVLPTEYTDDEMDKNGGKPKSFWAKKSLSETIKALDPDYSGGSFDESDLSSWVGRECIAVVKQEEYEGNVNNKIGRLLPS